MSDYQHHFEAKLVKRDFGEMYYSVVYVPKTVVSRIDFTKSKRQRIDGEINGHRIEAALIPAKGRWHLMISKKLQKILGVSLGDTVSVYFDIVDQDTLTIPQELQFALEANDVAREAWDALTAGKRRGFCHRVQSAKMPETRERRVEEIIHRIIVAS